MESKNKHRNWDKTLINEINYWKKAPIWTKSKISKATKDWFKYLK